MSVFAISMVKDEADVVAATLRRLATQVDQIIVSDNASCDGTAELLEQLADDLPLTVLHDPDPAYYQSAKMTALAARAAAAGATWVLPVDADEVWSSPFGRIADILAEWPYPLAGAELYDHVATAADDASETDPVSRICWRRRTPAPLPKVAARPVLPVTIHQGNHGAGYGATGLTLDRPLSIRHFPYRSVEQFVRKARNGAAAYAATDLPADHGAHWRQYGQLLEQNGPGAIDEIFHTWFHSPAPSDDDTLIFDPAP